MHKGPSPSTRGLSPLPLAPLPAGWSIRQSTLAEWLNRQPQGRLMVLNNREQCFGSGSGRIRIISPDLDPLQETLIRIRVAKKIVIKSTKIIRI